MSCSGSRTTFEYRRWRRPSLASHHRKASNISIHYSLAASTLTESSLDAKFLYDQILDMRPIRRGVLGPHDAGWIYARLRGCSVRTIPSPLLILHKIIVSIICFTLDIAITYHPRPMRHLSNGSQSKLYVVRRAGASSRRAKVAFRQSVARRQRYERRCVTTD